MRGVCSLAARCSIEALCFKIRNMDDYTTVEEQVDYGLDAIAPDRTIEVSLRDLFYVYEVIGEFVRFFHQPMNFPDIESVEKFLGNVDEGAVHLLWQCYYDKLRDVWPADIVEKIDDSVFEHPKPPYYFKPADESRQ